MKFLRKGFRLFIGAISISALAACGGGSGGPGGPSGASGASGAAGAPGGLLGGLGGNNLLGVSLTQGGGLSLTAQALQALGLSINALTPADLADLNLVGAGGPIASAQAVRRDGQLIGIQIPGLGAFASPSGPITLAPGIVLPALPLSIGR